MSFILVWHTYWIIAKYYFLRLLCLVNKNKQKSSKRYGFNCHICIQSILSHQFPKARNPPLTGRGYESPLRGTRGFPLLRPPSRHLQLPTRVSLLQSRRIQIAESREPDGGVENIVLHPFTRYTSLIIAALHCLSTLQILKHSKTGRMATQKMTK